ncbi:MAG: alpha/beta hydrolase [Rhodospirillaceae bacterium]|nr:alpha/beta hydrolase [Rhodospirillaceae bacterium]
MRARAGKALLAALLTAVLVGAAACAPITRPPGEPINRPLLAGDFFHTADGQVLPVKSWRLEKDPPRAVLIALHGFNDYSNFFAEPGAFLATRGIASYAYDQRGFGNAPGHGLWPGIDALVADLKTFAGLVRDRNPGTPLYLLGESMGGAVIMVAIADADAPEADGVILAAPAVWGRVTMPWYQRLALWIGVRLMPGAEVTGRGLKITPSDNIEMLKALGRDPLVIKATRIDAIYGLTNLMDRALERSARLKGPALILYGQKDEIIPRKPTQIMLDRVAAAAAKLPWRHRVAVYENGYHMLLRDLQAKTLWRDIAHWIADPSISLPSGADKGARERLDLTAAKGANIKERL